MWTWNNTLRNSHAQRKFIELIYNRTGKYVNCDPPSEIQVGSYGRIEKETGSLVVEGSIYNDSFREQLLSADIDLESGEYLPEDCPDETDFTTRSKNVKEVQLNLESIAEVPGIGSASIKGTWKFKKGTTGAVLLMHNSRMKRITSDVLEKLARIRLLQHMHLVTKVFHCPAVFLYLSDRSGEKISIGLLGSAPIVGGAGATAGGGSAMTWWSDTQSGLSCRGCEREHYFTPLYDLKHVRPQHYKQSSSLPKRIPGENLWFSPPIEASLKDLTKHITRVANYAHARGGFAEVWKCTYYVDPPPIKVAVKSLLVYTSDTPNETSKKHKRIRRELGICVRLDHPNILPVYGYTYGFGLFMAIVTPWAENGNLTTYLEHNDANLTLIRRFQILKNVASGLQYMHANNVIHGDLTGPNVLIDADGTACLSDFGLSLVYSEVVGVNQSSWTSSFHGNFRWLAPELLEVSETGLPVRPNKHSDTYSFGGIMLQVITSRIPYYYLHEPAVVLSVGGGVKPDRSRYPEFSDEYWFFMKECWSAVDKDRPSSERILEVIGNSLVSLSVSNTES
ncbi:kinase-like protein [Rhizopogon salebrosus TDB-379]|nr:kinase-like protein [Rhizopogon salebrosus TDB-379]